MKLIYIYIVVVMYVLYSHTYIIYIYIHTLILILVAFMPNKVQYILHRFLVKRVKKVYIYRVVP